MESSESECSVGQSVCNWVTPRAGTELSSDDSWKFCQRRYSVLYYRTNWEAKSFWKECVWTFQTRTWSFIGWNHLIKTICWKVKLKPSLFTFSSHFTSTQYNKYLLRAHGVPNTGVTKMNNTAVPVLRGYGPEEAQVMCLYVFSYTNFEVGICNLYASWLPGLSIVSIHFC